KVAGLEKEVADLKSKPPPPPPPASKDSPPLQKVFMQYQKPILIGSGVAAALFVLFGLWLGHAIWKTDTAQTASVVQSAPMDNSSIQSEIDVLKAKEAARDKADAKLTEALKNRAPLVPLTKLNDE